MPASCMSGPPSCMLAMILALEFFPPQRRYSNGLTASMDMASRRQAPHAVFFCFFSLAFLFFGLKLNLLLRLETEEVPTEEALPELCRNGVRASSLSEKILSGPSSESSFLAQAWLTRFRLSNLYCYIIFVSSLEHVFCKFEFGIRH